MRFTVLHFDSIGSTNEEALRLAKAGADEGVCVVADEQTSGRGRLGRKWVSTAGAGLYLSIVLRPKLEMRSLPLVTLMSGVAVHETLRQLGITADLKWVNDLLVGEKKIAGILAESAETVKGLAVVVGIGLNLKTPEGNDLAGIATSVEELTGRRTSRDEAAVTLTANIDKFYKDLLSVDGPAKILELWTARSSFAMGKHVTVHTENGTIAGVTEGLEPNGALRVRSLDGRLEIVSTGDVESLRPSNAAATKS